MAEEKILENENEMAAEDVQEQQAAEAAAAPVAQLEPEEAAEEQKSEIEALTQEVEELRAKLDQTVRFAAEAENSKKRMEREQEKLRKYAGENILRELLTTADNLDRALEQGSVEGGDPEQKLAALMTGVELTKKGLETMLERFEVTALDSVGQPFDAEQMDALTMEVSEEIPANHVLREFAKGYLFKDRMLRHAQVVVSSGPAKKE
ncbi:Protein GrpE [Candidatus Electronema halotolerans]